MKALPHAFSFISSCIATAILASPMPYIVQNKAELAQALEQYAINREGLELNSRSYNNPLLMGVTGVFALVSFGFMVKELSDKPLIEVKAPPQVLQQPIAPFVNNVNVRNVAVSHGDRAAKTKQEYTPDLIPTDSDSYTWMDTLHEVNCLLIYGEQGAGKTTYVEHEVECRKELGHQILVLDPHREYGAWEGLEVVGDGMDYQAIDDELGNISALIKSRYEQRATTPNFNPQPMTVICEEFTKWSAKCPNSDDFFSAALSDCRKVRVHVVYVAHARTMGALTKKVGMSAMFENGSTKLEILGKLNELGKTIPSGFADLYNSRDGKPRRVAIPDLSKVEPLPENVIELNKRRAS